ncbi:hypothetical protein GCM10025866_28110 [Naasia aerilata]|uniref:Cell division protein ZapE n=1 Tax=Naasia aerilata TaxID=1162966 RepID=A0ABM8GFP3_9MICO|nr:hypothetical protein GCM10025866_28110 [Naasia aerilata]
MDGEHRRGWFRRQKKQPAGKPGVYLDGGFGVGKTHLLAALWHRAPGPRYFGTFIEYTALVGALGYRETVALLTGATLVAIDEFELDDPGDTMVMTRLLGELVASGSRIAATSNTPPNALGEGRFAAADFLREIHAMAANFDVIRIDGLDYRRRHIEGRAATVPAADVEAVARAEAGGGAWTLDPFEAVVAHLATVHPSRYVKLVDGLSVVGFEDVAPLTSQTDALRFVALVDRLYDAQVRIVASGTPLIRCSATTCSLAGIGRSTCGRCRASSRSPRTRSSTPGETRCLHSPGARNTKETGNPRVRNVDPTG